MRESIFDIQAALNALADTEPGHWVHDASGVTREETPIPALVDREAYLPECSRHRILLIGGFSGEQADVDLALSAAALIGSSSDIALSVVPCANPDGLRLGVGPDNGVGGDPRRGYPPEGGFYDDMRDPEARYLWRWVSFMAPDIVVEVLHGADTGWESTHPAFDLGRSLNAGSLGPTDSMLAALAAGSPNGLAPMAGLRLTATEESLEEQIAAFMAECAKRKHASPSPAREELDARRSRSPLDVAKLLASQYGYSLDPVVYTQGVAISGRLRVTELTGSLAETAADIAATMEPLIKANSEIVAAGAGGPALAGLVWCDELSQATGDARYADALIATANRFRDVSNDQPPAPCDPDYRTEDMFFAAAILGRAYELTDDIAYIDILTKFLLDAKVQQSNGLFWHARSVPYFWGRGNTFAALGYTEVLSYVPEDHPDRADLLAIHVRHLDALAACLRPSGMLMEVLDVPGSYQEHTATAMFGYAVARGLRRGWLDDRHRPFLDLAWRGVTERIAMDGGLVDGCTSTGPQPDLRAYLDRKAEFGADERTGALALWFAVEMERLLRG